MAFPSDVSTIADTVRTVLVRAKQCRQAADSYIAQCDAGALRVNDVAQSLMDSFLRPVKVELASFATQPGLFDEFVRLRPTAFASAAAAQTAYQGALQAVTDMISFIEDNLPVDAQRRLLSLTVSQDDTGTLTQRTITAGASLTAFRAQLVLFRDAFDA